MSSDPLRPEDAPLSIYGPDGRPQFFSDPAMDRFVPVVLNLALELWVQSETIGHLKEALQDKGILVGDDLDERARAAISDPARDAAARDFVARVLAPLREAAGS